MIETFLSSPRLLRLARHRKPVTVMVLILSGALATWAIVQTLSVPLAIIAWVLFPTLLAALTYVVLEAAHRIHLQANAQAETERTLETLMRSNEALKTARRELAQQKMLAENLLAVARATGQQPVLEGTLQNTLDITAALTGTTHGSLILLDPAHNVTQYLLTQDDASLEFSKAVIDKVVKDGLAGWVIRSRQLARVDNTETDPRWLELPDQAVQVRSAIAIPFISQGEVIGVLTLAHSEPNHFTDAHEKLLASAADQISIALDNAKVFNKMMNLTSRLGLLYSLSHIATSADLETGLSQSLHSIQRVTNWPGLAVLLLDESQTALVTHTRTEDDLPEKLSLDDALVSDVWYTHETIIMEGLPTGPILVAPICAEERLLGVLLVKGEPGSVFEADDIELASSAAGTLATALTTDELRRKVEELQRGSTKKAD